MRQYVGDRLPEFTEAQKASLFGSTDFFALQHYSTKWIASSTEREDDSDYFGDQRVSEFVCNPYNNTPIGRPAESEWLYVYPPGIRNTVKWVADRYGNPPLYITGNGVDAPGEDGKAKDEAVEDWFRVKYYDEYIWNVLNAKNEGIDIKGYFAWSLLDCFEWDDGYAKVWRLGLNWNIHRHFRYILLIVL